jgi:hypothetical protein
MESDEVKGRIDLSALDPFSDPAARDALVARVLHRSAFELARRRRNGTGEVMWSAGASVLAVMAGWARPALAAAALAVLASAIALRTARPEQETALAGILEALAVPSPVEQWVEEERTPSTADLILTLEGGTAW